MTCPGLDDRQFNSRREQERVSKLSTDLGTALEVLRKKMSVGATTRSYLVLSTTLPSCLSIYLPMASVAYRLMKLQLCSGQKSYAGITNGRFSACPIWLWPAFNSGENSGQEKPPYWLWVTVLFHQRG